MTDYLLVEQPDSLCATLAAEQRMGVDTEFMREKTFFAELCLVQLATAKQIHCVDPLTGASSEAFWRSLAERTWVLHSARQDIEVIYQTTQCMPARIFDTQIAAGLLGFAPQIGYANLVQALFGADIAKSHTRADWSKRPLRTELLRYAAEDVEYLLPAHDELSNALRDKGRLTWAEEDSAQLLEPSLYDINPHAAIERLKGTRNLRGRRRDAAARLAAWRETEALQSNRPRQWIVRDPVLVELANRMPTRVEALQDIGGLPAGLIRRAGHRIIAAIAQSGSDAGDYQPPPAPDETRKALLKELQQRVARRADQLGLAAETLGSRKDINALIDQPDGNHRLASGWRRNLIGEELLELIQ